MHTLILAHLFETMTLAVKLLSLRNLRCFCDRVSCLLARTLTLLRTRTASYGSASGLTRFHIRFLPPRSRRWIPPRLLSAPPPNRNLLLRARTASHAPGISFQRCLWLHHFHPILDLGIALNLEANGRTGGFNQKQLRPGRHSSPQPTPPPLGCCRSERRAPNVHSH